MVIANEAPGGPGQWNESKVVDLLGSAAWKVMVAGGVVAAAIGLVTLVWPGATLAVVGVLFGVYLLAYGVTQLVGAFGPHAPGGSRALLVLSGSLSVLLGLMAFRSVAQSLLLLAVWIGFGWLLSGISMTVTAVSGPARPTSVWSGLLGVLTTLAGLTVVIWPFSSVATLAIVAGIWLVVIGATEIVHGIQIRCHITTSA
ncbi:HdeD family acid-resistance protein [Streptomyces sp. NPDC006602]|uniref:HdeD family acid-resistance protein n=1 Tax=Streptomyces sp. NPDC006602 TaxID=3364751 RepID=UPI0036B7540D